MQIIHDFKIPVKKYSELGQNNNFPHPEECPHCHDKLLKHGFYHRYVITIDKICYLILIRRYKCQYCGKTVSILPAFLFPRFQRSLNYIICCMKEYLLQKKLLLYKRAVYFYLHRFTCNIPGLIAFFRDKYHSLIPFKLSRIKKATKLIKMIWSWDAQILAKEYQDHFNQCFMAL